MLPFVVISSLNFVEQFSKNINIPESVSMFYFPLCIMRGGRCRGKAATQQITNLDNITAWQLSTTILIKYILSEQWWPSPSRYPTMSPASRHAIASRTLDRRNANWTPSTNQPNISQFNILHEKLEVGYRSRIRPDRRTKREDV